MVLFVCLLWFCVRIRVVRSAREGEGGGVAARRKSFVSFSLVCLGGGRGGVGEGVGCRSSDFRFSSWIFLPGREGGMGCT